VASYDGTNSNQLTGTLVFNYRVSGTDRAPRLSVKEFNLNGATIEDANGHPADLSAVSRFATNLQAGPAYLTSVTSAQTGDITRDQIVQLAVAVSEEVTVDTTNGAPTLALSDGATATYDAGASNPYAGVLVFDYAVGPNEYTTDLVVGGLNLNGATIKDPNGVDVDLSAIAGADLKLDVNAAIVTAVTSSPQTGEADSGQTVTLTLTLSKSVTVNTNSGSPTLHLDDGATATYNANASTPSAGTLVFNYVVRAIDETQNLQIAQVNLNGANVIDANGNAADLSAATTFATNFQIGPAFVDSVTTAESGEVDTGQTAQLTVALSEGVTVNTTHGSPTLSLSDGAVATYDATASTPSGGMLVFDYQVAAGDHTSDLQVLGYNPNGATIVDANGVAADLSGVAGSDLGLDINMAIVTGVTASPGTGEVNAGQKVTLTLALSIGVTVNTAAGSPTLSLNDGGRAIYDANASNPSTGTLAFDYTVGPTDQTESLYVTQVSLNGATVTNANGNPVDFAAASNFITNLQVGAGPLEISDDATGSFVSNEYDFAPVILNQSTQGVLDLRNLGSVNLVLSGATLSDPTSSFTIAAIAPGTIVAPGASVPLDITFAPHSVGQSTAQLELDTDDPSGPTKIKVVGAGESPTAYARVTPNDNNNFGGIAVGATKTDNKLFTITNDGAAPLVISAINISDTNDFSLTGLPGNLSSNPISLAYRQTFSFGTIFHPKNGGLLPGFINIVTNDPAHPTIRVDAVGTGLDPANNVHWGNDYVAIDAGQGTLYAKSDASGAYNFFLPSNANYHEAVFDPQSGLLGHEDGKTGPSGTGVDLAYNLLFDGARAPDTDYDGLPDDVEFAIGTSPNNPDTNNDGVSDYNAIKVGLDPRSGRQIATGILSSLPLQGEARSVLLQGSLADPSKETAYVATGSYGLAIVDVSNFQKPVVLGQLRMEGGTATSVAVDPVLGLAAVADGPYGAANDTGGLRIVNIADPTKPVLVQTIQINPSVVQAVGGILYTNDGATLQAYDMATGEKLQDLAPSGGAGITSIVHDGSMLYTMDGNRTLRTFDISSGLMVQKGALTLDFGGTDKLFVADGIAYVAAEYRQVVSTFNGYGTVDVSDPSNPRVIARPTQGIASIAMALNGSGLGVSVGTALDASLTPVLMVENTSDPTNTGQFVTRVNLPQTASDIALGGGIAFVADGSSGLEVVNYEPFDTNNVPPTITVTPPASTQVTEGSTVTLAAKISDDVQVRNVAILLNGKVIKNDVTYPFDLSAVMPSIAANGSSQVTVQIQATDTGGNTTTSAPIALTLVPDTTPPQIVNQNVAENAVEGATFRTLIYTFSKPLDLSTVNASTFALTGPGGATIAPDSIETRIGNEVVQVTYDPLAQGQYHFTIDGGVKDTAGVALGSSVTTDFSIQIYSVQWVAASGGNWSTAANWSTGVVPISTDDVLVDLSGQTVNVDQNVLISSINSTGNLLVGGSHTFHITNSASLAAAIINPGGPWSETLLFDGPTTITNVTLRDIASVLGGAGNVTITGNLDWGSVSWDSVMTGTGKTLLAANATASLSGNVDIDRELDIAGQATIVPVPHSANATAATVDFGNQGGPSTYPVSGKLSILSGGSVILDGTDFIGINGNSINGNTNGNVIENAGTLTKTGTNTATIGLVSFTNDAGGVVNVQAGTLYFNGGGGSNAGTINVAAGALLQFDGSNPFTMSGASALTDAGDLFVRSTVTTTGQLSVGGTLHLQNGTLNFNNALNLASLLINNSGVLNSSAMVTTSSLTIGGGGPLFGDGNLDGTASVVVTGHFDWQGWSGMTGSGKTILAAGATMDIALNNPGICGVTRELDIAGAATMAAGGNILRFGASNVTLSVLAGGSLAFSDGNSLDTYFASNDAIANFGTIRTGVGTVTFNGPALNNSGLVDVQGGTLNLWSGGSNTGTILVEGASSNLGLGGTFTLAAGSTLSDQGNLVVSGGTVTANSQMSIGGALTINSGTLNVNAALALSQSSLIVNGTLNLNAALSAPNLTNVFAAGTFNTGANALSLVNLTVGGTLAGSSTVTVTGALNFTGTMSGSGKTVVGSGASVTIGNTASLMRELDIAGQLSLANMSLAIGSYDYSAQKYSAGTLGILSGATVSLGDGVNFNNNNFGSTPSQLINAGTLFKTGAGTSTISVALANSGTVDVEGGTLNLNGGGSNAGTIRAAAGTTLQLQGAFSLAQGSQLNDAGNLTINVSSGSKLNASQLSVGGALTISSGELDVSNAITPASLTINNSGILNTSTALTLANLSLSGFSAQLRGSGDIALAGTASLGGNAQLFGPGKLTMANGVALSIGSVSLGRELDISAQASIAASSSISLYAYDSSINAYSSGVLSILSAGTLSLADNDSINTSSFGGGTLLNAGSLMKTGTSLSTISSDQTHFTNTGTVDIQGGTLSLFGGMSNNGTVTVEAGGELDIAGTLTGTGNINVAGKLALNSSTILGSGKTVIQSGGTLSTIGSVSVTLGQELDVSGQASIAANSTLNLDAKDPVTNNEDRGTLQVLSGGSLTLADGITIANTATYSDGEVDNAGTLTKTGTGTSTIAVALGNTATVDVKGGTLKLKGSVNNTGSIKANGGNVVIAAAVTDGGSASISGSSLFEFGAASNEIVTFAAGATGTLRLDDSQDFTGMVAALALGETLDLADIHFATVQAPMVVVSGGNTTVTVKDGTHTANIILVGNYQDAIFMVVSDGAGGTDLELISASSTFSDQWSSASGGDWTTGSNWSSGSSPGAQDTVRLPLTAGETVTLSSGSPAVAQLVQTGAGTFELNGGSLTVSATTGMAGTLFIQSGTFTANGTAVLGTLTLDGMLAGSGTVFITSAFNWAADGSSGAIMSGTGKTVVTAGATMSVGSGSPSQVTLGRELDIAGTAIIAGGTTVRFGVADAGAASGFDPGTLAVMAGGSLSMADAVTFSDASSGAAANALNNAGTLSKTGSASSTVGVALNNLAGGTINVQGGTLDLAGAVSNAGTIAVASGAALKLDGTVTQSAGAQLNDAGDLISNANSTLAGTVSVGGALSVTGGTLNLGAALAPISVSIGHGRLNANGPYSSSLQGSLRTQTLTLNQSDSVLAGTGSYVNVTGALNWSAGTLDQTSGGVQVQSGATLTAGAVQLALGGYLDVYGQGSVLANTTIQFGAANSSGGYDSAYLYVESGGTLGLADGVLLSVNSNAPYDYLYNYGTLTKTGTGASKIAVNLNNYGTLDVKGGALELAGSIYNYPYNGSATIAADGGAIKFDNGFFSGGNDTIAANSQIEFASYAYENVTFLAATGTLKLDASTSFGGSIAGLNGQDAIDLADITFGANTAATYSGTASSGTLKVTDGTHTANIKFTGDFTTATFSLASDGQSGTMLRNDLTLTGLTSGNAMDGTPVSVALTSSAGVTNLAYQWLEYNTTAHAWQNVANATSATFAPGEADEGKQLEVQLSYTDAGNIAQTRVASAGTVGDPTPSITVSINGTPQEGQPLTANVNVTDTDTAKGSISGYQWQVNLGTAAKPQWASEGNYTYVTGFTKSNNIQTNLIKEVPTGTFVANNTFATPFQITSDNNGRNFYDGGGVLTINVAIPDVTDVYTLINAYGPSSGRQLASLEFIGSQGTTQTFTLVNGTDTRDFFQGYNGSATNGINGTTTQNAFAVINVQDAGGSGNVNTGGTGTYVVDEQDFHLSAAFATQMLQQIVITSLGNGTPILLGVTAQSAGGTGTGLTYTPTEADEGAALRFVANYTDDEGHVVQLASAATAPVQDAANDEAGQPTPTDRWLANTGGTWTSSDASDWSTGAVPGASDVVSFLLPVGETLTYSDGATTIAQLFGDGAGTLSVTGGSLAVTGATALGGSLIIGAAATFNAGGALTLPGTVSISGTFTSTAAASTIAAPVTNSGVIDVQAGAVTFTGAVVNTGTIKADGGNVKIGSTLVDAGAAIISGSSQLELGAAASEIVTFAANASGMLVLDNSQNFTGAVAGFTPQDAVDLRDIAFTSLQSPAFARTSLAGNLSLTDGTHASRITFTGDLSATGFSLASDGQGGTLVRNDLTLSGLTGGNAVEGTPVSVALVNGTGVHNLSYQWLEWNAGTSSWQNVANATTASFTPGEGDDGKQLAVQLSYIDANGHARTGIASAGTVADLQPTVTVNVSGTAQEGQQLTAAVNVSDQDGTAGSLSGVQWQVNKGASANPTWANAGTYTYVTGFTKTHNIQNNLIKEFPTGILAANNAFATPFDITSDGNGNNFNDALNGNGSKLTINVSIANATDVYTLMNAYGPPAGRQLATVEFKGSQGADQTFTLVNGTDVRDWYQGTAANTINGTTTQNAFTVTNTNEAFGYGTHLIDEQDFHLSSTFATQTLQQIILTALGNGTPILLGMTAQSASSQTGTGTAYTPTEADEGSQLRAVATYTDDEGRALAFPSAPTAPVQDAANDEPGQPTPTDTWVSSKSGVWTASDVSDWSSGAVPGSTDVVSLLLPFGATVSYIAPNSTIAQLNEDSAGALSIAGGALTVTGAAAVEGSLSVGAGATLNVGGALSVGSALTVGGTLTMNGAANSNVGASLTNSGTIDVQAGALNLNGAVINTGTIKADGGNVTIAGALSDGGNASISGSSVFEFGAASNEKVTFASGASGTLRLDDSQDFHGTVAGLTTADTLDLRDINFASVQTPTYLNGTSSGGTLHVTDGTHTANVALLGNYLASTFTPSSDSHGGTNIVDPEMLGGVQPLATPPHA
jgi:hypothetical protein